MSHRNFSRGALVVGVLLVLSCKQGSGGRLGSASGERQGSPSVAGMIRALRGQLDFDLAAQASSLAAAPAQQNAPTASGPIRVTMGQGSAQAPGTVRMEFAVTFHEPLAQFGDLERLASGAEFVRVGSLSTSNLIHEPQNLRVVSEEVGRALYYLRAADCTTAQRCVRLGTGGETLKESKEKTIRLEFRQTDSGVWVLKGFRYFGHALIEDYGMPIELVMTDDRDG